MKLFKKFLLASIAFIAVSCSPLANGQFSIDNSGDNTQQTQGGDDTPVDDVPPQGGDDTPIDDVPPQGGDDNPPQGGDDVPPQGGEDVPPQGGEDTPVEDTPVSVQSVSLNYTSYSLKVRETLQLTATVLPANATNKKVTWRKTSGTSFINLSDNGLITAVKSGTSKVKVITEDGAKYTYCVVTVLETTIPAESVSLDKNALSIKQGQSASLTATVLPSDASNKNVTWSSSDTSVAIVEKGVVTGVKSGSTATITAKTVDGGFTADCVVNVTEPIHAASVSLNETSHTLSVGYSFTLSPTVLPSDAYNKSVTWSSSNSSVASVSNGTIKALSVGSSTITAKTVDGGYTATCKVDVEESKEAAWTVMIYMCGADLESTYANKTSVYIDGYTYSNPSGCGLATLDIKEILSVQNKPDDVNIILETGGASAWTNKSYGKYGDYNISSTALQRHHVENGKIVLDDELTYASMGLTSTFQSFLEWGLTEYPAEKTAVILWNHGGGMSGVCFDEKKSDDSLLGNEVISALKGAFKKVGRSSEDKLEWIGYDACLMQVQDLAEMNSQYFNYMIGSQETENGEGWVYNNWIDDLYAKKSTEVILKEIVDSFIKEYGSNSNQTLSYLNLANVQEYKTAWENMASALKDKITSKNSSNFKSLVKKAKYYADESYEYYCLFDAKDFINKLAANSTFNPGSEYTNAFIDAHANLVAYSKAGSRAGNSYGLSLYFGKSSYTAGTDTNFTNWASIVNSYGISSEYYY